MHHLKIEFLKAKNQIANQYYSGVPNNSPPRLLIFAYFGGPPPPPFLPPFFLPSLFIRMFKSFKSYISNSQANSIYFNIGSQYNKK